ncbi:MAG: MATE family efflux transporter [Muribaculaceae bacterium]|nr:MATE family efflux transporter [Muribaculaceae bacterium]
MAQLSTILMEYIDASMVGQLGAGPAASIGLMATTTWLFWGIGTATATGYAVQVAHLIGGGRNEEARSVLRQSIIIVLGLACLLAIIGLVIAPHLPHWLGGNDDIIAGSVSYFSIFALSLPVMFMAYLSSSMLRCSGNMLIPGIFNVVMCVLDVLFNMLMIFPSRDVNLLGFQIFLPGAGLGVTGAALGTLFAEIVAGGIMIYYMLFRSDKLSHPARNIRKWWSLKKTTIKRACIISWPLAIERVVMCSAQILVTAIVAPLGTAAIAANAFGVTAEGLCYMPGYGISDAATTLVGQSFGAGKKHLAKSFGRITIVLGIGVMAVLGIVMWLLAAEMMSFFTPDSEVIALGTMALRTEAWAEPMFGAAIVTYGVFIGAGYTVTPAVINFSCIWGVRITLSLLLASSLGLFGVWLAMAIELSVRGLIFLFVFCRGRWINKALKITPDNMVSVQEIEQPDEFIL